MLEYNLSKTPQKKNISFYKLGDWNVFVGINVMYFFTQNTNIL
jgi:hypothetical protein